MATTQNKSELVIELCKDAGLFPGEEGSQHWQTHLAEMKPLAIEKAFALLNGRTGVVEVEIDNPFLMNTRLWGPLMGDANLSDEERTPYDRGEGRGAQKNRYPRRAYETNLKGHLHHLPHRGSDDPHHLLRRADYASDGR